MALGIAIAVDGKADADLANASQVEVYESVGAPTTYRIKYDLSIAEGDIPLLVDGRLDPGSELSVLVPVEDVEYCLVKGPVHGQAVRLEHGGARSSLEVRGSDTTVVMDREAKTVLWTNSTDSDAVSTILSPYGYTPDIEATSSTHEEKKHALVQRDSDLRFVRRLARRNGYLFWVTSDSKGVETAHFRSPPLEGEAEAELVINLDSPSIDSIDIEWDVERPTSVVAAQVDLNNKKEIDGSVSESGLAALGTVALADITGDTRSVQLASPADDSGDLQARGEALLTEAGWFLRATTRTSLETIGKLVRSHTLVEVKGAGSRHSGAYFVTSVRHTLDATAHRMDIELVRNGWGS